MSNLPPLEIGKTITLLSDLFGRKSPLKIPSIMLWGPPGVGKSDACNQIAQNIAQIKNKIVDVTDVRLLLFQAIDLRGIPVPDVNKEFAIWLRPQIFNMNPSDDVINMLILDEISAAPPSVQAAAYQLTLDRKVGEHKLPDNCIIIAAGNRVTDKSVAYKMPKALANRLLHLELKPTVPDWKKWAVVRGIDGRIIGYMNYKQTDSVLFDFDPSSDDLSFRTPRTWEMTSDLIEELENVQSIYPLIAGTIGPGAATDFIAYCRLYEKLPDINKIFSGECTSVPLEPDILYALSGAILGNSNGRNQDEINNMCNYLEKVSDEIGFLTIGDCFLNPDLRVKICMSPAWSRFMLPKWGRNLFERG